MKPTYGRVSRHGVVPLAFSLDTIGPMTRTVSENAHLLNVIAGFDKADPASAEVPTPDFANNLDAGVEGLKLGVVRHFYTHDLEADAGRGAITRGCFGGVRIVRCDGSGNQNSATGRICRLQSNHSGVGSLRHSRALVENQTARLRGVNRERLLVGAFHRAVDYVQATRMRRKLSADLEQAMHNVDAVVTVSSMDPVCLIDDPQAIASSYARQARTPFNVTGQPAIAIPCGFTETGLPLSMQIAARVFDEATVYRIAHAYEQATPWKDRRPALTT